MSSDHREDLDTEQFWGVRRAAAWNLADSAADPWSSHFTSTSNNDPLHNTYAQQTQDNQAGFLPNSLNGRATASATSYATSQQPSGPSHRRSTQPTFSTSGLAPVTEFTEDWLDLREAPPSETFDWVIGLQVSSNNSIGESPSGPSQDLDAEDMPASTQSQGQRPTVVNLTGEQSLQEGPRNRRHLRSVKRTGESSSRHGVSTKRSRVESSDPVEKPDARNETLSTTEEILQSQQAKAIAAQDEDQAGPVKVAQRTCNICMDTLKDATVTACGHMFCHKCLTQALLVSERTSMSLMGKCPNCRKPLSRKRVNNIIPITFMKKSGFPKRGK